MIITNTPEIMLYIYTICNPYQIFFENFGFELKLQLSAEENDVSQKVNELV